MATPTTAGGALLVREYFEKGWYPGGFKNSGPPFWPSGALIKAIMVHSGQPMAGLLTPLGTLDTK
jgi:hypothetical protein